MTDLTRYRGDTYADEITITGSDGLPLDITGYVFVMTVDPSKSPTDETNNIMQINGVILDAANGLVEFAPTATDVDQTPRNYYYDIQMTDTSGRKRTIDSGKYTIVQDITKA